MQKVIVKIKTNITYQTGKMTSSNKQNIIKEPGASIPEFLRRRQQRKDAES